MGRNGGSPSIDPNLKSSVPVDRQGIGLTSKTGMVYEDGASACKELWEVNGWMKSMGEEQALERLDCNPLR